MTEIQVSPITAESMQKEIRQDILPWTLLPLVIIGLVLALVDRQNAPPPSGTAMGMLLMTLAGVVWGIRSRSHTLAAWTLTLGSLGLVALSWFWFPAAWLHQLLLFPVIVAGLTLSPQAAMSTSLLACLTLLMRMPYDNWSARLSFLFPNVAMLLTAAFLLYISQGAQQTIIAWAWQGYAEARRNLEQARDRQMELKQALEDLALANSQTARLNELLAGARHAVEQARRAKEEFVANVSHELRTPLNMIIGFSDEILERPDVYARQLPANLLSDVAAIKRNSEHLARLVDDVLELAEADTGRMQLFMEETRIQDVIQEAVQAVSALFKKKGLSLTVEAPNELPTITCDRARIRQVILNLLSNAGRFTTEGGASVRAELDDGNIVVRVIDSGPGMSPEQVDHLFQPFQQADPSIRRRFGGTGLGLAISKRFVEMHHGAIWLESELGCGTTACFSLPVHDSLLVEGSRRWFSPYQGYEARTRPSLAPDASVLPTLAIVEEGDTLTRLVRRYIEDMTIVSVSSFAEAAQAVQSQAAVAVVVNEPGPLMGASGNGGGSLGNGSRSAFAAMSFDVPIIQCALPTRWGMLERLGVQDYLVKPIRRSRLMESIENIAPQARSILIVEDDLEALPLFTRMLDASAHGQTLYTAQDGATALKLLREHHPDLLLLDLVLPDIDGFGVLQAKNEDPEIAATPVIVISAQDLRREPLTSPVLRVTRPQGLAAQELAHAIRALITALKPRFGAPTPRETGDP